MNQRNNTDTDDVENPALMAAQLNGELSKHGYSPVYGIEQLDMSDAIDRCDTLGQVREFLSWNDWSDERIDEIIETLAGVQA